MQTDPHGPSAFASARLPRMRAEFASVVDFTDVIPPTPFRRRLRAAPECYASATPELADYEQAARLRRDQCLPP
jgi:hypothetical protein